MFLSVGTIDSMTLAGRSRSIDRQKQVTRYGNTAWTGRLHQIDAERGAMLRNGSAPPSLAGGVPARRFPSPFSPMT